MKSEKRKKKIFLTGGSGLLGTRLIELLARRYTIASFDRNGVPDSIKTLCQEFTGDLTKKEDVAQAVLSFKPEIIIHAAAMTDVDGCEENKDLAYQVNVEGTKNIVDEAVRLSCHLIYISTDFVFDGKKGSYSENDTPNPVDYYGQTKYEGEGVVSKAKTQSLIIRIAYPYRAHFEKTDKIRWMLPKLQNSEEITAVSDQYGTPTFIDDIVSVLDTMIEKKVTGLYHVVGATRASWFEVAQAVCRVFGFDEKLVKPMRYADFIAGKKRAPRPYDSSLSIEKLRHDLGLSMSTLEEGITKIKQQMEKV